MSVLINDGPKDFAEITAFVLDKDALQKNDIEISVSFGEHGKDKANNIKKGDSISINLNIKSKAGITGSFTVLIQTKEGTNRYLTCHLKVERILPTFEATPNKMNMRILRGRSRVFDISIKNTGKVTASNLRVKLPGSSIIKVSSFGTLNQTNAAINLEEGKRATLSLIVIVPLEHDLGQVSGSFSIVSDETSLLIPLTIIITSDLQVKTHRQAFLIL